MGSVVGDGVERTIRRNGALAQCHRIILTSLNERKALFNWKCSGLLPMSNPTMVALGKQSRHVSFTQA
jgi:hypothetical protein